MIATTQTSNPLIQSNVSVESSLEQACGRLKAAGLRITQPRIAILSALLKRSQPATIEQIHDDLTNSSCDLVTVYRCLAAFEELGLVRRSYFHNGTSLYQIQMGGEPVYHVVSKTDNTVESLSPELTAELRAVIKKIEADLKTQGYGEVSHMAEFFATAPAAVRQPAMAHAS
ncbi:MAG: transcriptional repressor [Verrucomicrobia bacterium]|jgi:Fur family ferric uptake transcriptional regulator|nr:transcriptional repressor [Verrucomicrobiota bacterium]